MSDISNRQKFKEIVLCQKFSLFLFSHQRDVTHANKKRKRRTKCLFLNNYSIPNQVQL